MTLIDAAAILGALAWIPSIVAVIRGLVTRPQVRVVTQQMVEIGFTTFGPIANIRVAFAAARKDIIISDVQMELRHEAGDIRQLSWHGIVQPLGRINTPSGMAFSEKEQSVLAIKLNNRDIEERFIRFQDPKFHIGKREHMENIIKKMTYMKETGVFDIETLSRSQEIVEMATYTKQAFNWKSGRYTLVFRLKSPQRFTVKDEQYMFNLSPIDIELLEKNKPLIEPAYQDEMRQGAPGHVPQALQWNWRYPVLKVKT